MKKLTMILMIAAAFSTIGFGQTKKPKAAKTSAGNQAVKVKPKIFMILEITVHDAGVYEQYRINVEPLIKKYGGKYLVRSGGAAFDDDPDTKLTPVEGNWNPDRLIVVQWDSIEQLQKFSSSAEYKKVAELRAKSATTKSVIVKEYLKN